MGLQVLMLGRLRPELGVCGTHEGVPVADLRHPEVVQDAIARLAAPEGAVLVLCQDRDLREVRRQLALVSVALPRVTTVVEPVPGSPLAVAVCAGVVKDDDGSRDSALQLATLDTLRDQLWSAVWVPSVVKFERPQPSLVQHVRSWFGGAGFLASFTDGVVYTCKASSVPVPDSAPRGGSLLVAETAPPRWVTSSFQTGVGASDRRELESWRDPRDAFGVPASVELLVLPADLDDPRGTWDEVAECLGCGNRHGRDVCPYCRMVPPGSAQNHDEDVQGVDA